MDTYSILEDVLGGAIWWGILVLAPIFWGLLRRFLPKVAPLLLYAIVGTAASLTLYVLVNVSLTLSDIEDKAPQPKTNEQTISEWISDESTPGIEMPLAKLPNDERFRTNLLYDKLTVNLFIKKNRPDFLVASIPQPLNEEQQKWWRGLTESERHDVLFYLQREIGLDPDIAIGILGAESDQNQPFPMMFHVDYYIPIDAGLTKTWLWREIEAASRYFRVYRHSLNVYFEAQAHGNR